MPRSQAPKREQTMVNVVGVDDVTIPLSGLE